MRLAKILLPSLLLKLGCASGHVPAPASAAEHEAAAEDNERLAASHDHAAATAPVCGDVPGIYEICWTLSDTEDEHRALAERHRRLAAAHQAQAAQLREAEDTACVGVAREDRDISPFLRTRDIRRVELLDPARAEDESSIPVVEVTFAPVPGLDAANLERLVACHLARNAVLGHDVPEMEYCPLVPRGVTTVVDARAELPTVTILADQSTHAEVRERATRLAQRER